MPISLDNPLIVMAVNSAVVTLSLLYLVFIVARIRQGKLNELPFYGLFLLQVPFYWLGKGALFSWYAIPSGMGFLVGAIGGAEALSRTALRRWWDPAGNSTGQRWVVGVVAVAFFASQLAVLLVMGPTMREIGIDARTRLTGTAGFVESDYLQRYPKNERVTVAVGDVGIIGYRLSGDVRILDLWGLVTPESLEFKRTPSYLVPLLRKHEPEYVVLPERAMSGRQPLLTGYTGPLFAGQEAREWFHRYYELAFETPEVAYNRISPSPYQVYARRLDGS